MSRPAARLESTADLGTRWPLQPDRAEAPGDSVPQVSQSLADADAGLAWQPLSPTPSHYLKSAPFWPEFSQLFAAAGEQGLRYPERGAICSKTASLSVSMKARSDLPLADGPCPPSTLEQRTSLQMLQHG